MACGGCLDIALATVELHLRGTLLPEYVPVELWTGNRIEHGLWLDHGLLGRMALRTAVSGELAFGWLGA